MKRTLGCVGCLVLCAAAGAWAAGPLAPAELKCEYRVDPAGIGETAPRLTWILTGEGRGLYQAAYQILAADSEAALARDEGTLWDSGKVASSESLLIPYGGKALASRAQCFWKVRVWARGQEAPSDWSAPARFSVGLLAPEDWSAEWIGYDAPAEDEAVPRDPYDGSFWVWYPEGVAPEAFPSGKRWLRKGFTVPQGAKIARAVLYATADNGARVNLNGERVGRGEEAIQSHSKRYEFDVTALVKPGENQLAAEVENAQGNAGFIATLDVTLEDGSMLSIRTDKTWRAANEKPGEGWRDPKFDDKKWTAAQEVEAYPGKPWGPLFGKDMYLPPAPYLRREFAAKGDVKRATLYATALGIYETRLNGKRVGDVQLAPGWTDYNKRVYYNTYDVTGLIAPGAANAWGAILADGWYAGHVGNRGRGVYGSEPRFLGQLEIEYADGTTERVVTDGAWKASYGEVRAADLLMGETRDLRRALPGWDAAALDDAAWKPVAVTPRAEVKAPVQAYPGNPVRIMETITAKSMTEPQPGVHVYEMGQNMVGWPRITVTGKAGDVVTVRHAERLQDDGMLYTVALRSARATDQYTLAADGPVTLEPAFTFHGFQYVEITGVAAPPAPEQVVGVVIHNDIPRAAVFEASDPLLTKLASNIVWGQKGNYLEAPTDCPQRDERLGWTGDAQFFMPTALYTADIGAFHTKWLVDLVQDSQHADGSFAHVSPDVGIGAGAVAWGDAALICPYLMHRFYGDTRVIERHFDNLVKGMDFLTRTSADHIRKDLGFGDWLNLGGGAKDEVICTAYYAYLARIMSEMAGVIGRNDVAARYAGLYQSIRDAFIKAFVSDDGTILESSQTGYALAFAFDLLPEEKRADAAKHFEAEVARFDNHLATGFIGTPRLLPALVAAGKEDIAYRLLMNKTYPSWLYQVTLGSTTMWERWNGWTPEQGFADPGMNSFNHYAFGAVGEFMYSHVAGIAPLQTAFRTVQVRPRPGGGLSSARLAHRCIRGEIVSDWKLDGGKMRLTVAIPQNTDAVICLPTNAPESVTEGGQPATAVFGKNIRVENGETVIRCGGGSYTFELPFAG